MNIAFQANYCMWQILFRFPGEAPAPVRYFMYADLGLITFIKNEELC